MPDIEFPTSSGSAPGYLAVPEGESGPATIVLQEWWGVDGHIRSICDRFAAEGFFALAPDLYRGETTDQPSEAQQKMMAMSMDDAEKDMCGAAAYLRSQPGVQGTGVGAVGFCLGGGLAVWAAATCPEIDAAVTFYYVMPHGKPDFGGIRGPVLGHFGTADEFVPVEDARSSRGAARRGRGRRLRVLRGRRPRVLQRHEPARDLRRGRARPRVAPHGRLPAGPPVLLIRSAAIVLAAAAAAGGALAGGAVPRARPAAPARAADAPWSEPAALGSCPVVGSPRVLFPADAPDHPTGPGAIVWSAGAACPGGAGARVDALGAGEQAGAPARPSPAPVGALTAAAAPAGLIAIAGADARDGAGELLVQGSPGGSLRTLGAWRPPLALSTGYLGDLAAAGLARGRRGSEQLLLRVERHYARRLGAGAGAAGGGGITAVAAAMDYRSDVLLAWARGGSLYARYLPASGAPLPARRLGPAGGDPRIALMLSDDGRGIAMWSAQGARGSDLYLDQSAPGLRFGAPRCSNARRRPPDRPPKARPS